MERLFINCDCCNTVSQSSVITEFSCKHVSCKKCVQFSIISNFFSCGISKDFFTNDSITLRCLNCKKGTTVLENKKIEDIKTTNLCDYCEQQKAALICSKCELNSCEECYKLKHNVTKKSMEHEVFYLSGKFDKKIAKCSCNENNLAERFCFLCKISICKQCCDAKHGGHKVEIIDDLFFQKNSENNVKIFQKYLNIKEFLKARFDETGKQILENEEKIITEINMEVDQTINLLNDFRKNEIENLKKKEIHTKINKVQNLFTTIDEFFNNEISNSLISPNISFTLENINMDINNFLSIPVELENTNMKFLSKINETVTNHLKKENNLQFKGGYLGPKNQLNFIEPSDLKTLVSEKFEPFIRIENDRINSKWAKENMMSIFKRNPKKNNDPENEYICFAYPVDQGDIEIYNFTIKAIEQTITGHQIPVKGIDKFEDYLFSFSNDIRIFDLHTLELLKILKNTYSNEHFNACALFRDFYCETADGTRNLLAFSIENNSSPIYLYSYDNGECNEIKSFPNTEKQWSHIIHHFQSPKCEKTFVVVGYQMSNIHFLDIKTGNLVCKFPSLQYGVRSIKFAIEDDGEYAYYALGNVSNKNAVIRKGKIEFKEKPNFGTIELENYIKDRQVFDLEMWDENYILISLEEYFMLVDRSTLQVVKKSERFPESFVSNIIKFSEQGGKDYFATISQQEKMIKIYKCF